MQWNKHLCPKNTTKIRCEIYEKKAYPELTLI